MSGITRHQRNRVLLGEHRPVAWWRYVAVFVLAGAIYFGVSAVHGDKSALGHTLIWLVAMTVGGGLLWLWKRLPTRARTEPPRYTRNELMRATFQGFLLFGVLFLPYPIRHGATGRDWVLGPILLLGFIGGWLLFVVPSERRDAEPMDVEERQSSPHPPAKLR